jgi:hypothetical protein
MKKFLVLLLCLGIGVPVAAQVSERPSDTPAPEALAPATVSSDAISSLPAGTAVRMKLETAISTRRNKAGDRFIGRVTEGVKQNGMTIIPAGASLEGRIARATEHRRIRGTPTIDLRPDTVVMPNGNRFSINAVVVDTSARPDVDVNDEGKLKGRGHDSSDWKETGIGAGAGAIAGGVIAGAHGALIGAGVGATASVVHWLIKTRSAELPAGTELVLELSHPMSLGNAASGGQ